MIDHLGLSVVDAARSKAFYIKALEPLGFAVVMEWEGHVGIGPKGKPEFWISAGAPTTPHLHVAFRANSRAEVDAFHKAAMAAGGRDNGAPGLRPEYHPNYYGAFVLDPDGHNVEAVTHQPEP